MEHFEPFSNAERHPPQRFSTVAASERADYV
jgi:hypothetical protein